MSAIYIHLPFCLSHCIYCDFYVELHATTERRTQYLQALQQEIDYYLAQQPNLPVSSIYFGGGTPGLFSADEIVGILSTIRSHAAFAEDIEITLEANPDGTASPLADYRAVGVNRLSVGIQSFQPNELKRLSRVHSAEDAIAFVHQAAEVGFRRLSIDLMYGVPEQTAESWNATLAQALALPVDHISMYGLKVEAGTRLDALITAGRMAVPPDDDTVPMYFTALDRLERAGFSAYEISNLAKPGGESRHNLVYWDNRPYWGFGVSAHGYMHGYRTENPRNLAAYQASPTTFADKQYCSPKEALENAFIFGLRKQVGVDIAALEAEHAFDFQTQYAPRLKHFLAEGYLMLEAGRLKMARKAIPVSNGILDVFLD